MRKAPSHDAFASDPAYIVFTLLFGDYDFCRATPIQQGCVSVLYEAVNLPENVQAKELEIYPVVATPLIRHVDLRENFKTKFRQVPTAHTF